MAPLPQRPEPNLQTLTTPNIFIQRVQKPGLGGIRNICPGAALHVDVGIIEVEAEAAKEATHGLRESDLKLRIWSLGSRGLE